jgi:signal transduction histidine kinase
MSKKRLNKLFSIENIQSTVGTDGEQGTGLGLQIVKEYIGNHGGKI